MSVTVVLDEELVGQLKPQAEAVQASVRDFAVRVLQDAMLRPAGSHAWNKLNARRLDLIALEYSQGLSAAEAQELEALQHVVSKASEPEDWRLLKLLGDREQRANPSSEPHHE
jgi:membrane-bound lytic murein transglycosylase MltF